MATLPSYVVMVVDGYSEEIDPQVDSVKMERGPVKYRVRNSMARASITATLFFRNQSDEASFRTWYFQTIKRIGTFSFVHPGTGQTITANFKDGTIGKLVPLSSTFGEFHRQVTLEYLVG